MSNASTELEMPSPATQKGTVVVPYKGNLRNLTQLPSLEELRLLLLQAYREAQSFATANPKISNVDSLHKRISRDLSFVEKLLRTPAPQEHDPGARLLITALVAPENIVPGVEPGFQVVSVPSTTANPGPSAHIEELCCMEGNINTNSPVVTCAKGPEEVPSQKESQLAPSKPPSFVDQHALLVFNPTICQSSDQGTCSGTSPPWFPLATKAATLSAVQKMVPVNQGIALPGELGGCAPPPTNDILQGQETFSSPETNTTAVVETAIPAWQLSRMQGALNNLHGFLGEFLAAQHAPNVVAIGCRYPCGPPPTVAQVRLPLTCGLLRCRPCCSPCLWQCAQWGIQPPDKWPKCVEVDISAQGGHVWIEAKNHEMFGVESMHWTGAGSHYKGLRQQLIEVLAAAQLRCNWRRWQPPAVAVFFPSGAAPDIIQEVERMGALPLVGEGALHPLPNPPPEPLVTNLDVTTMCALVSEVSNNDVSDGRLETWSLGNPHWRECYLTETRERLIPCLTPYLDGRELVASSLAVDQFEKLVELWAGPSERLRWAQLQTRLRVYPTSVLQNEDRVVDMTGPVARLQCLGAVPKAVLELGDKLHATTLTANGSMIRSAQQQGVYLEVFIHRPVWLTSL